MHHDVERDRAARCESGRTPERGDRNPFVVDALQPSRAPGLGLIPQGAVASREIPPFAAKIGLRIRARIAVRDFRWHARPCVPRLQNAGRRKWKHAAVALAGDRRTHCLALSRNARLSPGEGQWRSWTKGDSNPLTSKPKPHPFRDPAVTTKACVGVESPVHPFRSLACPRGVAAAWQREWCENGFQIRRSEAG
jgi:hypothetical protein